MDHFELVSEFAPTGDQPQAIAQLVEYFVSYSDFKSFSVLKCPFYPYSPYNSD